MMFARVGFVAVVMTGCVVNQYGDGDGGGTSGGGGSTTGSGAACESVAASGLVADGPFEGSFTFDGSSASHPVKGTLDAYKRTLSGTFSFIDGRLSYSATLSGQIATDGKVTGSWDATASGGPTLHGSIDGKTNNIDFCGTWSNTNGKGGGLKLSRPSDDLCYFLPKSELTTGGFSGSFDFSQISGAMGFLPVKATVQSDTRSLGGPLEFSSGSKIYKGSYSGTVDGNGATTGTWSAGALTGDFAGITDNVTFCGFWANTSGKYGKLRLARD